MESEALGAILKVVATVVVGVPLVVFLLQERLIFMPRPLSEAAQSDIRTRFPKGQNVFAQAADGVRVHAWHLPGPPEAPLVLYFGGNAEEVSWMLGVASEAAPRVSWLLVDYRGYGRSDGSPSEKALVEDALLWYDRFAPQAKKIFVMGRSLGSGVAVQLAAQRPVAGAILVAPFDSMVELGKHYYPFLPVNWMLRHRFDSAALAPKIRAPLLCVVAARDEIIPAARSQRLYDAWGGPKRWIALEGAGHNSTDDHVRYWPSILSFLK